MQLIAAGEEDARGLFQRGEPFPVGSVAARRHVNDAHALRPEPPENFPVLPADFFRFVRGDRHHDETRPAPAREPDEFGEDRAIALFIFAAADDEQQPLRMR